MVLSPPPLGTPCAIELLPSGSLKERNEPWSRRSGSSPSCWPPSVDVEDLAGAGPAFEELGAGLVDVGGDEVQALDGAGGRGVRHDGDRACGARGRELHDTERLTGSVVDVQSGAAFPMENASARSTSETGTTMTSSMTSSFQSIVTSVLRVGGITDVVAVPIRPHAPPGAVLAITGDFPWPEAGTSTGHRRGLSHGHGQVCATSA